MAVTLPIAFVQLMGTSYTAKIGFRLRTENGRADEVDINVYSYQYYQYYESGKPDDVFVICCNISQEYRCTDAFATHRVPAVTACTLCGTPRGLKISVGPARDDVIGFKVAPGNDAVPQVNTPPSQSSLGITSSRVPA